MGEVNSSSAVVYGTHKIIHACTNSRYQVTFPSPTWLGYEAKEVGLGLPNHSSYKPKSAVCCLFRLAL